MYDDSVGTRKTMGDVDVLYHDGLYHLFHLVLPNHDFIAHAVSRDGLKWERVENSIFIGHPGSWDDAMLWTMNVTRDPWDPSTWRMFYTGLARKDRQLVQRIGLATSKDLYVWRKAATRWKRVIHPGVNSADAAQMVTAEYAADSYLPIEAEAPHYEASIDDGRHWVSWRDPFFYAGDGRRLLLCSGRINHGPLTRRGCVAALEEGPDGTFKALPPLFHPGLYDDIEVPNLLSLESEFYLIGSIREDAKIRYWHAKSLAGPWKTYHDNVLLPQGNYAGRICHDQHGVLFWNFFSRNSNRMADNLMPPPKRLIRDTSGLLRATRFEGFEKRIARQGEASKISALQSCVSATHPLACTICQYEGDELRIENDSGFQAFAFDEDYSHFRLRGTLELRGLGKCGLIVRLNRETLDGYYLSLDLVKGIAQLRSWGTDYRASGDQMMAFKSLQAAYWRIVEEGRAQFDLLTHGSYIECSINGHVLLSVVDEQYAQGAVGFYLESAAAVVSDLQIEHLHAPSQSDHHLAVG